MGEEKATDFRNSFLPSFVSLNVFSTYSRIFGNTAPVNREFEGAHRPSHRLTWSNFEVIFFGENRSKRTENYPFVTLCNTNLSRSLFHTHTHTNKHTHSFREKMDIPREKSLNNRLNLLRPTGHVIHKQFNIQQLYVLPTLYLCVLYLSENKQRLVSLTA